MLSSIGSNLEQTANKSPKRIHREGKDFEVGGCKTKSNYTFAMELVDLASMKTEDTAKKEEQRD